MNQYKLTTTDGVEITDRSATVWMIDGNKQVWSTYAKAMQALKEAMREAGDTISFYGPVCLYGAPKPIVAGTLEMVKV
jgi:hypothetical protein